MRKGKKDEQYKFIVWIGKHHYKQLGDGRKTLKGPYAGATGELQIYATRGSKHDWIPEAWPPKKVLMTLEELPDDKEQQEKS